MDTKWWLWLGAACSVLLFGGLFVAAVFTLIPSVCGCPPTAAFALETADANGTAVTLEYQGGETVPALELRVSVGDENATWAEWGAMRSDSEVRAGDALKLGHVTPGTEVSVVWRNPEETDTERLFSGVVDGPS